MRHRIAAAAAACLIPLIAPATGHAATLTFTVETIAFDGRRIFADQMKTDKVSETGQALADFQDISFLSGNGQSHNHVTASATLGIDAAAGAFRFGSATTANPSFEAFPLVFANANVDFQLDEVLTASGSGRAMISVDVDGTVEQAGDPRSRSNLVSNTLTTRNADANVTGSSTFSVADGSFPAGTDLITVDETLSIQLDVVDGEAIALRYSGRSRAGASADFRFGLRSESTIDFLNTATFRIDTTPGLTLTPSDPVFLSGLLTDGTGDGDGNSDGGVAPVPLPAALPLLAAGLALMGGLSRRRSRRPA